MEHEAGDVYGRVNSVPALLSTSGSTSYKAGCVVLLLRFIIEIRWN